MFNGLKLYRGLKLNTRLSFGLNINVSHGINSCLFKLMAANFNKKAEAAAKPATPTPPPKGDKEVKGGKPQPPSLPKIKEGEGFFTKEQYRFIRNYNKNNEEYMDTYGSMRRFHEESLLNKVEFMSKSLRRNNLNRGVHPSHKHIIPVKRVRTSKDTLEKVYKQGDIVACLMGREEFPEFDFIVDRQFTRKLRQIENYHTKILYLQHEGELIPCTVANLENHWKLGHPLKLEFRRFIVGRPNLITFNIELVAQDENPFIGTFDCEWVQLYQFVSIWCFNENIPRFIEIDVRSVAPNVPFKLLDLERILPDGMFLHRKYDMILDQPIITMADSYNLAIASTKFTFDQNDINNVFDEGGEADSEWNEKLEGMQGLMEKFNKDEEEKQLHKKRRYVQFNQASAKKMIATRDLDNKARKQVMTHGGGGSTKDEKKKKDKPEKADKDNDD